MPWVKKEDCLGCSICVEACPVEAISIEDEKAEIHMDLCIRCGICHDVCPQNAVRHDSEKIPQEVEANIEWTRDLMKHYKTREEIAGFIERIKKHFNKEKLVIEKTLERLESIEI
jgi:ferredoxin